MAETSHPYNSYIRILEEELIPAMGCTEPIALAYCAAKAKELLGRTPQQVTVEASGSIIKNVKSVIVPNTDHMKGIPAAAAAGIIAGDPAKGLEVIAQVTAPQIEAMRQFLEQVPIQVVHVDNGFTFEICVSLAAGEETARVRIVNYHTNIVRMEKNGQVLLDIPVDDDEDETGLTDRSCLNIADILYFADHVDLSRIKPVLDRQIAYNTAIAQEGLRGNWGSNIGSVLLDTYGDNVLVRAKAMAAAGSDARMSGCEMPVIINSGSGNQGITASLPVIEYARELKVSNDKLYRALAVANLVTIHQKTGIGRLSAFCGAVSAGAGAGAGIAYLMGADLNGISHTVSNAIATTGGIVCDGAKASCASKIASAVEAGILGYNMHIRGQDFQPDDGLVAETPEGTIENIGRLGKEGMKHTNEEIIRIMVGE